MRYHHFLYDFCQRSCTALILLFLFFFVYALPSVYFVLSLTAIFMYALVYEWGHHVLNPAYRYYSSQASCSPPRWIIFFFYLTPLYPFLPFIALLWIASTCRTLFVPLIILVTVHDTAAYLTGSWIGNHYCAPSISPYKTWEGIIGGIGATIIALFIVLYAYGITVPSPLVLVLLSTIFGACCTGGDLFESWIKRKLAIKDFGSALPGHGGILDRCDALLCVATTIFLFHLASSSTRLHLSALPYFAHRLPCS